MTAAWVKRYGGSRTVALTGPDEAAAYLDDVTELEDPAAFGGIGECNAEV